MTSDLALQPLRVGVEGASSQRFFKRLGQSWSRTAQLCVFGHQSSAEHLRDDQKASVVN
jgi:hypothetical protein